VKQPIRQILASLALLLSALVQAEDRYITLASTTSTEASGLFAHLLPTFRAATGIEVRVVAVGTGQAFAIGRNGDADALLVHDTAGEERFISDGSGLERRDVMYNDYVVVGPTDDPARVREAQTVAEAFALLAKAQASFASRGDDSGTHRAERRIWQAAGIEPSGGWYRELGSGMGAALNTAAGMGAYALADRGTWISFVNRQDLEILFEGDPLLFNQYGSIVVNPRRHPHVRHELATQWHEWLLSDAGQAAIAAYALDGEQLFFPNAVTTRRPRASG
jgi:tungstate transport system substrate-binding protein